MNCPICIVAPLSLGSLESSLSSQNCARCGGNWIPGAQYWKWLENQGENLPEVDAQTSDLPISEPTAHLDCPECKWRMVKYMVGRGTGFSLDHCHSCKGIWLDKNEWEVLRKRNLHDDLNSMLTEFWQSEALKEERRKRFERINQTKFGAEDYAEIKRIRDWLEGHDKKHELLAYLTDDDPLNV
ncbi:MAG: zf-TFIIB domain-containing protein [Pyrinomonadaceae bacterium]|nr:zf-TFIIB domain-containing protein [Pyrinomonadaceae bacterium]